jgi:hypothetical protein
MKHDAPKAPTYGLRPLETRICNAEKIMASAPGLPVPGSNIRVTITNYDENTISIHVALFQAHGLEGEKYEEVIGWTFGVPKRTLLAMIQHHPGALREALNGVGAALESAVKN